MTNKIFVALVASLSFLPISPSYSADGTIEFIGEIIDQACEVKTESKNIQVQLGRIPKANLPNVGSKSIPVKFTIVLVNCPVSISSATVSFDATPFSGDNTVIALKTASNSATGVGVQLTDNKNATVTLLSPSNEYPLLPTVENNLDFTANYVAKAIPVTVGPANASATFLISYN